jgi:hypothetical protein
MAPGALLAPTLRDYEYKIVEKQYRKEMVIPDDTSLNKKELVDFPIEKSRMRNIWWIILIFIFAPALYGFSLGLNAIATPLVLQFFIAYSATAVFSLNSALVIDLYPGASASATAVNNLMRCSVGAAGVAVVQLIIDAIGARPTFLLFTLITALLSPLLVLVALRSAVKTRERREAGEGGDEKRAGCGEIGFWGGERAELVLCNALYEI